LPFYFFFARFIPYLGNFVWGIFMFAKKTFLFIYFLVFAFSLFALPSGLDFLFDQQENRRDTNRQYPKPAQKKESSWWNPFNGNDLPSEKFRLINQPKKWKEISISGTNLVGMQDIISSNLDGYSRELTDLEKYILSAKEEIKNRRGKGKDFASCDGELKGIKERLRIVREKISYYEKLRNSSVADLVKNQSKKESLQIDKEMRSHEISSYFEHIFDKDNLIKTGTLTVATAAGVIVSYYSSKIGFGYISSVIGKPTLVRESNRLGIKQILKDFWLQKVLGRPEVQANMQEVILNPELKKTLSDFAFDVKSSYQNGLPHRNAIFYGAPGTGKTMFAKRLALFCNMDYAILSGADFSQFSDGQAIEELHKFFDWAQHSKRGLIVFIDEADSFLGNRKNLDKNSTDIVNAFLSRTGQGLEKIMFVFATNNPEELDSAVLSRIHKKINFSLPAFNERVEIIKLYLKKYILDDQRILKEHGAKVVKRINMSSDINDYYINNIAQRTNGFSARALEQVISELRIAAYNRGNGILTKELVEASVIQKIKEFNQEKSW
jgi:ATPase family AAA domain-containing protein 3A/B